MRKLTQRKLRGLFRQAGPTDRPTEQAGAAASSIVTYGRNSIGG